MIDVLDKPFSELERDGIELTVVVGEMTMIWSAKTREDWFPVFSYKEISLMYAMGKERAIKCLELAYSLKQHVSPSCSVSRTRLQGK